MMIFYVPLIVAGAVASIFARPPTGYQSNKKWFEKHPTFDAYRQAHPQYLRNGRVACYKCGGTHILFRGVSGPMDTNKIHYCVTCGAPLYRSTH